jgi:hypothetical protein
MGDVDSFLKAIPEAAKNPYSLIAYTVSALLFVVSATKLSQVKKKTAQLILAKLDSVNPNERKQVVDGILGTVLPAKLTGQQYLHGQKMKYVFLAFIAVLAVIAPISVIALLESSKAASNSPVIDKTGENHSSEATVRIQLWPRPEIKQRFIKDNDVRLYIVAEDKQFDLKPFVPREDFLDEITNVGRELIGKQVELTISPRDKYRIGQSRRYLTPLMRVEVYPLGKNPIPEITSIQKPSGEKVFLTTGLPSTEAYELKVFLAKSEKNSPLSVSAGCPQILSLQGREFTVNTKLDVVDYKGNQVEGAWAGNEPGTENNKPTEVSVDGRFMKAYFGVPSDASGKKLFMRIYNFSGRPAAEIPLAINADCSLHKRDN